MNTRWIVPFLILVAISVAGVLAPSASSNAPLNGELVYSDIAWIMCASGLVMWMTPGLSFFYGGMVNRKSVISTMLQSFICLGVVSLLWVVVGYSLCFGHSYGGIIGDPIEFFMFRNVGMQPTHPQITLTVPLILHAMYQMKFAIITPALITGSFAERVRFSSYLLFICLFTLLIYCPLAHWTWHPDGFLFQWGVLDFAGGTVVHMSAGFAALAGAYVLGRRESHKRKESHSPANIPYVMLGTGMLWFGWFGFNAGSALSANGIATHAFTTTNMASASAALTWIFFDGLRGRKVSAMGFCIGAVVGLVAITPAAGFVTVGSSIFIGFIASIISNMAVHYKTKSTLDDTLDVFPCHGVGGIVGMLATGIFATKAVNPLGSGLIDGNVQTFLAHLKGLGVVAVFTFVGSYLLYKLVDKILPMRVTPEQEAIGLDMSQHGEKF